ncbi:MAG: DNA-3-methyladenine glycosylase I [Acidimicrobiia bacterium]|nr:DNA-3-methyladenine glycosylase I [Acidimicrobiia bacterium]
MFESRHEMEVDMPADLTARNIRTIDQFLELFARAIFASGLSWAVVDRNWAAIRLAFGRFSAVDVAALTNRDIERLCATPGVIGNQRKIAAVGRAAQLLVERKAEFGSVGRWIQSLGDFPDQQDGLRSIPFIGPFGAYYVLSVAGFAVPDYETWFNEYGPASTRRAG